MYEPRGKAPLSRRRFLRRMVWHVVTAVALLLLSVIGGALVLRALEPLSLSEALLHTSLLVSGLGLAQIPDSLGGRLFTSLFALYSGFVALAVSGILVAPVAHRLLHLFHWDETDVAGAGSSSTQDMAADRSADSIEG